MNAKIILIFSLLFFGFRVGYSQTTNELKAEVAGRYWGAVIMASEFQNSYCGKSIVIDKRYTDVIAAKAEILNSFPKSVHSELNQFLTREKEINARNEFHGWWVKIPNDKCNEAQKLFWNIFDESLSKWKRIK